MFSIGIIARYLLFRNSSRLRTTLATIVQAASSGASIDGSGGRSPNETAFFAASGSFAYVSYWAA
jgi:hypothetical protein